MMPSWQKKYHPLYSKIRDNFDKRVIEWISSKEELICSSPKSHSYLKNPFSEIRTRRYKSGKIRILYVLSTECSKFWNEIPENPEILFLYVDLRRDETYAEALKALRKHKIL